MLTNNLVDYSSPKQSPYLLGSLPYNRQMIPTDYVKGSDYGECYTDGWKIGTTIDKEAYKKQIDRILNDYNNGTSRKEKEDGTCCHWQSVYSFFQQY